MTSFLENLKNSVLQLEAEIPQKQAILQDIKSCIEHLESKVAGVVDEVKTDLGLSQAETIQAAPEQLQTIKVINDIDTDAAAQSEAMQMVAEQENTQAP